jgi:predicted nucleotidyltransferase
MSIKAVNLLEGTNALKTLKYLCENSGRDFTGSAVQKALGISRAGVFLAMKQLIKEGFVKNEIRGNTGIYSADASNPAVKQFKIMMNIVELNGTVEKLCRHMISATLYGSCARGEDMADSDMDIFIISHDPDRVREILKKIKLKRKIQAVIKTPVETAGFKQKEALYAREVERGVILWEERDEHRVRGVSEKG